MRFSRYFQELMLAYKAELDDLRSDSEGKDVMRHRLKEKREQLAYLLPMMGSNPEMLAPAFHNAFLFMNPLSFESLSSKEANKLPSWKSLSSAVKLEPWAEKMAQMVLVEPDGDAFMVTAACLEYLSRSHHTRALAASSVDDDNEENQQDEDTELHENGDLDGNYGRHGRDDGDDGDDVDLEEAGADWLAEQGFDRKD
ncbi:hypothetical protein [Undibacterium danionis]|uniref:Uncharacterized protein n=1 Tax=Undibacterium danionis TaxID=1812100 RepID=A0ABV6I9Q0_9BURK